MRKSKFGWLGMVILGLGSALLLGLPVTAQPKGKFVPWQQPRDWDTFVAQADYVPSAFVVGFTSNRPENLGQIRERIQQVALENKLRVVDSSEAYLGKLQQEPKQGTSSSSIRASVRGDITPNVCNNLIQYFEVPELATSPDAKRLAELIKALSDDLGSKFPNDVYTVEGDTSGHPAPAPDWAKPAIGTSAEPVSAPDVTVAVLDTGYNAMPDYEPALSWNAVFRLPNGTPNPDFTSTDLAKIPDNFAQGGARGHGTGVASIIRGPDEIDGQANTISLTSDAELYPIKVCNGDTCSSVSVALGICKAISEPSVGVINLSLSGPPNVLVKGAVEDAINAGVTVVAAAANINTRAVNPTGGAVIDPARWNETPGHYKFDYRFYPAAYSKGAAENAEGIISVGAAQPALGGFEWAVFNPKSPHWQIAPDQTRIVSNLNETIDLMAPGLAQ
jgi:Subtilase family